MKYVLTYAGPRDMARVRELFPAHRTTWKGFLDRGELLMIGPFSEPGQGAMGIFTTRAAAEAFVKADPFVVEGLVSHWEIKEWIEAIVPEPGQGVAARGEQAARAREQRGLTNPGGTPLP